MAENDDHILTGPRVAAALGLFGPLGAGLALMAVAFPHLNLLFWFGFLISLAGAGGALWVGYSEISIRSGVGILIAGMAVIDVVAPVGVLLYALTLSPDIPDERLPGFTAIAVINIQDAMVYGDKYVFRYTDAEGATVDFYLSASDVFYFAIKDIHGETEMIHIPSGRNGIPLFKFVSLMFEAGTGSNYSFMRVSLNGVIIKEEKFEFHLDLGSRNWDGGILWAPVGGLMPAKLMLEEIGRWPGTFERKQAKEMEKNIRDRYDIE